ncbi:right-handed parallel beta-helix repeat-containing protein [Niallia taxi]|uniref:right-handed parallel beta-helix repeat-containing protein n=1 Tax=Niallia taxi TaxID=2499688 RepID=UPI00203F5524|nr:right-handed parallel beta-helix repeat-containing protein [Niallia taxi]MCM3216354.1 right-handed parallel beta-helix repeat-containing protein [Niallia taxi]
MKRLVFFSVVLLMLGLGYFTFHQLYKEEIKVYDVKNDFGAKGDGIADDTQSIQKAIEGIPSGSTLRIPEGVYNLNGDNAFDVKTDYGPSKSLFKIDKPLTIIMDGAILRTKTSDNVGVFWINKTSNVTIKGGFLTGDIIPTDGGLTSRIGVLIQESKNSKIQGLTTRNFSQGINLYYSEDISIKDCVTEQNKGSGIISFRSKNSTIDSCFVRNSGDGHLSMYGGGQNNTVSNNIVIEDRLDNKGQQGITIESEKDSLITNNKVSGFYYGIDVKNGAERCEIRNNRSFNNVVNIAIRPGDPDNLQTVSNDIVIANNNVLDNRDADNNSGIYIQVGENHKIYNNVIKKKKLIYKNEVLSDNKEGSDEIYNNVFID